VTLQLATLLATLTVSQNPTINPETGTVRDVQTRIEPPVVTPRPSTRRPVALDHRAARHDPAAAHHLHHRLHLPWPYAAAPPR
jgi:hypothetical protein